MAYSVLGLRISGTKQRRSGFTSLVNIGILVGNEGEQMDRLTLLTEKPTYIVKHTPEYVMYGMFDSKVKSFDADAPGVLSIALTVPSGMQLANGESPYSLLREAYDTFRTKYMEPVSDGRDSFKNVEYDQEIFQQIVDRYPLEKRSGRYITMNPSGITGILKVADYDLKEFFRNTNYPEFSRYKEIEVGTKCDDKVSPDLKNLEIPIPPVKYQIYVNDKPTGSYLQYPNESFKATQPETEDYSYQPIEFSLEELFSAPGNKIERDGSVARLDQTGEKIFCTLKHVAKPYNLFFNEKNIEPRLWNFLHKGLQDGKVRIIANKQDVTRFCLNGSKIYPDLARNFEPRFEPDEVLLEKQSYRLSITRTDNRANHEIILTPSMEKKVTAVAGGGSSEEWHGGSSSGGSIAGQTISGGGSNRVSDGTNGGSTGGGNNENFYKRQLANLQNKHEDLKKKHSRLKIIAMILGGVCLVTLLILVYVLMPKNPKSGDELLKEEIENVEEQEKKGAEDPTLLQGDNKAGEEEPPVGQEQLPPETPVAVAPKQEEIPVVKETSEEKPKEEKKVEEKPKYNPENVLSSVLSFLGTINYDDKSKNQKQLKQLRNIWDTGDPNKEVINKNMRDKIEALVDISKYTNSKNKTAIIQLLRTHGPYTSLAEVNVVYNEVTTLL